MPLSTRTVPSCRSPPEPERSLRFADTFPEHEQAPAVLGAAADDLYEMKELERAIASARTLIVRYPNTDESLIRSAWAVVAHSSIDLAEYVDAEEAYSQVLALTDAEDETRPSVVDGLAAAIYKQGEEAGLLEDHRAAAAHFLRIRDVAPDSTIRSNAEYDAAIALMKVEEWNQASQVLEEFRVTHPEHELGPRRSLPSSIARSGSSPVPQQNTNACRPRRKIRKSAVKRCWWPAVSMTRPKPLPMRSASMSSM